MTQFVRMNTDQRILEVGTDEANRLISQDKAGATATSGIVQFLQSWTHPVTGREYQAGDLEKFHEDDAGESAILEELKATNVARALVR